MNKAKVIFLSLVALGMVSGVASAASYSTVIRYSDSYHEHEPGFYPVHRSNHYPWRYRSYRLKHHLYNQHRHYRTHRFNRHDRPHSLRRYDRHRYGLGGGFSFHYYDYDHPRGDRYNNHKRRDKRRYTPNYRH